MKLKSLLAAAGIALIAAGLFPAQSSSAKSNSLVMYFSWGGTTEKMAKMIANTTGADLFRIEPAEEYPKSYKPCTEVVKDELDRGIFRTVKAAPDFSKYDTVFVGVPVWWHTAPTLMTHFLEENGSQLKGKTIVPFCTYQATYRDETLKAIVNATPAALHRDGYGTNSPKQSDVDAWLKENGF